MHSYLEAWFHDKKNINLMVIQPQVEHTGLPQAACLFH